MYFEKIRTLCVENKYFTRGTNNQYNKMFELIDSGATAHDVALAIWLCSDDVELEVIEKQVEDIIGKMTFKKAFQILEKRNIKEVSIYNTNRNYIMDTPYMDGSLNYFRTENIYNSDSEIENVSICDDIAVIHYCKN